METNGLRINEVVETTGFEPATSCSRSKRSTKLSHVSTNVRSVGIKLYACPKGL